LQSSGQQRNQLGLVDTLVDGVAVIIYFVVRTSNSFWDNGLCFVCNEAINRGVRIRDKVEAANLKLIDTISSAG